MTTERDELADHLADSIFRYTGVTTSSSKSMAEELLAAGYRKQQTITAPEGLDALPEESVIRDASGVVRERINDEETGSALWLGPRGWMLTRNFRDSHFPATVLHDPTDAL